MDSAPIFVHSLFRAGSTYVFNVFRRSTAGYWCYQEPLHEYIRHAATAPERLLDLHFDLEATLRHPHLEKPYFWELYEVRHAISSLFRKDFSYDSFFASEGHASFAALSEYLQCLLDNSRGRPMLQCCRTFGRVAALRKTFGGKHIHLWRNPLDQWWSYQVDSYFDVTTQLILNAVDPPEVLQATKKMCGIADFHDANIENEIAHAAGHRLASHSSFAAFYALWLYSLIEMEKTVDISINIDSLSSSGEYRHRMLRSFADAGIPEIDFSDCQIAQAAYVDRDVAFFSEQEKRVHDLFIEHGYKADDVDAVMRLRGVCRPALRSSVKSLTEDAARVREVALKQIDRLAESQRVLLDQVAALERDRQFIGALDSERGALRKTLDSANDELRTTAARLAQATEEGSALRIQITELRQELASTIAEADLQRADANSLRQMVRVAETYASNLETELSRARSTIDERAHELSQARSRIDEMTNDLSLARVRIDALYLEMTRWHGVANDINRHLHAVYATRSWRLTAPLRSAQQWIRRFDLSTSAGFMRLIDLSNGALLRLLTRVGRYVQDRPAVKRPLIRLLTRFPRRYQQLRSIVFSHTMRPSDTTAVCGAQPSPGDTAENVALTQESLLKPSVLRVYRRLLDARKAAANGLR